MDHTRAATAERVASRRAGSALGVHHVAIETRDLDASIRWYAEFLGLEPTWTLRTFSPVTLARLPGISRLVELAKDGLRLHVFERDQCGAGPASGDGAVQHVCLTVPSARALEGLRAAWLRLYPRYAAHFAVQEQPTEVLLDDDGSRSCYLRDINGVELELRCEPTVGAE
jgi:catechol 2,3-dioxygenase-like lactoylglutathione lyase family enzyme